MSGAGPRPRGHVIRAYPRDVADVLAAVLPSLGVLALFVLAVRAMVHADRRERAAAARFQAEEAPPPRAARADPQDDDPSA